MAAAEDISAISAEGEAPTPDRLAEEASPPFAKDAAAMSGASCGTAKRSAISARRETSRSRGRAGRACASGQATAHRRDFAPLFSYVANIVGDRADVAPLIPVGFNPHAYEPRGEDIKRLGLLDVVALKGVGHDDFAERMIRASEHPNVAIIGPNRHAARFRRRRRSDFGRQIDR